MNTEENHQRGESTARSWFDIRAVMLRLLWLLDIFEILFRHEMGHFSHKGEMKY